MKSPISSHSRRALTIVLIALSASAVFAKVNTVSVVGSFDGHGIGIIQGGTLQASASGSGMRRESGDSPTL